MTMAAALTAFAARAKQGFLAGPAAGRSAIVYVGNAAGDLDTIVSMAVYFAKTGRKKG